MALGLQGGDDYSNDPNDYSLGSAAGGDSGGGFSSDGVSAAGAALTAFNPLIGGAVTLLGGLMRNKSSAKQAQRQMEFQERMSSTAHQREVADLYAAGLNPILSATGGRGASSPGGAMAEQHDILSPAVSTALQVKGNMAQVEQLEASARNLGADTSLKGSQEISTLAHGDLMRAQNKEAEANTSLLLAKAISEAKEPAVKDALIALHQMQARELGQRITESRARVPLHAAHAAESRARVPLINAEVGLSNARQTLTRAEAESAWRDFDLRDDFSGSFSDRMNMLLNPYSSVLGGIVGGVLGSSARSQGRARLSRPDPRSGYKDADGYGLHW